MKFWQLHSLLRETPGAIRSAARARAEWTRFGDWLHDLDAIVDAQDREKLDAPLPPEFVKDALSRVSMDFFADQDGWLRGGRFTSGDERLSAVEAFERYGGAALEDVIEKGCTHIGWKLS